MPFIACLNNVKTTHAANTTTRTPDPHPNQRHRPVNIDATRKETGHANTKSHTHNQTTLVMKMLASTMQISNNNPTNPHPHHPTTAGHTMQTGKGRTRTTNLAADPSGPNSVLDPIPHQREAMSTQDYSRRIPPAGSLRQDLSCAPQQAEARASTIPLVNTTMRAGNP